MIVLFVSMSSIGMSAHKGSLKGTAFFLPTRTAIPVNLSQKDSTLEQQYKKAETLFENLNKSVFSSTAYRSFTLPEAKKFKQFKIRLMGFNCYE